MKVLVIEDEKDLRESISQFLASEQYTCEQAIDFASAMEKISLHDYTCIVLDINLPGGSGLDILRELKNNNKADGIIIISARNAIDDKVYGLRAGADDYLVKPFHLPELAARVAAIIRRRSFEGKQVLYIGNLKLNVDEKTAEIEDKMIDLTRKEYDLLIYFVSNKNKVITKNAIAEHLWGDAMEGAGSYDFIYTHIKNLRKKLIVAGSPDYIKSIYGLGYKFSIS